MIIKLCQPYECGLKHVQQSFRLLLDIIMNIRVQQNLNGNMYEFFRCSLENANHINMAWNMFNRDLDHIENIQQNLKG